ncbi:MAG TPA: hypothetical protein VJH95_05355 [Candidatus Nanoarchaeia archaeon]|nr:hypothetical protein [Candidatus Nanoarchaeia archaeon]
MKVAITKLSTNGQIVFHSKIRKSEEELKAGRFTRADTAMSAEEIDDLLMA